MKAHWRSAGAGKDNASKSQLELSVIFLRGRNTMRSSPFHEEPWKCKTKSGVGPLSNTSRD